MARSEKRAIPEPDFHPGTDLAWRMDGAGMTLDDIARKSGIPAEKWQSLIDFEIRLTPEMEDGLAAAFGESVDYWRGAQRGYEEHVAEVQARDAAESEYPLLARYHAHAAEKQGWIWLNLHSGQQVLDLREHLGIEELGSADAKLDRQFVVIGDRHAYRPEPLLMWLRQGETDLADLTLADFDPEGFASCLTGVTNRWRMRRLLKRAPFAALPNLTDFCLQHGVGLVILENLPDAGATGAVRWRDDGKPWIQMTFAHQWMDEFWYDFYRLAAHIVHHPRQNVLYLATPTDASGKRRNGAAAASDHGDNGASHQPLGTASDDVVRIGEIDSGDDHRGGNGVNDAGERAANAQRMADVAEDFANEILTANLHPFWSNFADTRGNDADYIAREADNHGIHPGLLVARLIKEGVIAADHPGIAQLRTRVHLRERDGLRALDV